MDADTATDKTSPAGVAEPTFLHLASPLLLAEAKALPKEDGADKGALCSAILIIERRAGGVPTWTDGEAADWLDEAAERIRKGPFKATLEAVQMETQGWRPAGSPEAKAPIGARKALYLTSYGGTFVGNSSSRTVANLHRLAKMVREGDEELSAAFYLQNLKRLTGAVSY